MRPYTTYKAFGGVLTALAMPNAIAILLQFSPDGHPLPQVRVLLPAALSAFGVYIFVASERKLKQLKAAQQTNSVEQAVGMQADWKAIGITAFLLILYLTVIVARTNRWF